MIKHVIYYFLSRTSAGIAYFLMSVLLVNTLGAKNYGLFSVVLVSAQTTAFAFSIWVGLAASRRLPGLPTDLVEHEISLFSFWCLATSFAAAIIFIFETIFGGITVDRYTLIGGSLFCFFYGLHETQMYILNSRQHVFEYSVSNIIRYIGGLLAVIIAVFYFRLAGAGVLLAMALMTGLALAIPITMRHLYLAFRIKRKDIWPSLSSIVSLGVPSVVIFGLWTFTSFTNRLFLHWQGNDHELGMYSAVSDLINGPTALLFQIVILTWSPQIMAAANKFHELELRRRCSEYFGASLLLAIPGVPALWIVGPGLINQLAGGALGEKAGSVVGWVALMSVFICLYSVAGSVLIALRRVKSVTIITAVTLIGNAFVVRAFSSDALTTAQNSAFTIGFGAASLGIWAMKVARVTPDKIFLAAASFSVVVVWTILQLLGHQFIMTQPILALIAVIIASIMICIVLNILNIRIIIFNKILNFMYL